MHLNMIRILSIHFLFLICISNASSFNQSVTEDEELYINSLRETLNNEFYEKTLPAVSKYMPPGLNQHGHKATGAKTLIETHERTLNEALNRARIDYRLANVNYLLPSHSIEQQQGAPLDYVQHVKDTIVNPYKTEREIWLQENELPRIRGKYQVPGLRQHGGIGVECTNAINAMYDSIDLLYKISRLGKRDALEQLILLADKGDHSAESSLCILYFKGHASLKRDEGLANVYAQRSLAWLENETLKGNPVAQTNLGLYYEYGTGVGKNLLTATQHYKMAASRGYDRAQYHLGDCNMFGRGIVKNESEAFRWIRLSADQGYAEAQSTLGLDYLHGFSITKDIGEALKWLSLAADQGDASAQFNLGGCYLSNESGVIKNYAESVKWFRLAANQGNDSAQYFLGYAYTHGRGVAIDEVEAVKWYKLAAEQGNVEAQLNLAACYKNGSGVTIDAREAVKWFRPAADQGDVRAQLYLAGCYCNGEGVIKNEIEEVKWLSLAADQGNAEAQYNLAECYLKGKGVAKNNVKAVKWYHLSADQGHVNAQLYLALCYLKGEVLVKNKAEAIKYLLLSANQGNACAQSIIDKLI